MIQQLYEVRKDVPVVAVAPNNDLLEKLQSNLMEVRARGGSSTYSPIPSPQGNVVNRSLKSVWFAASPRIGVMWKISSIVRSVEPWL